MSTRLALLAVADVVGGPWQPALHLVALSSLRRRNLGSWNRQRLVLAALLLALTPLLGHVPATLLLLIVTASVLLLIAFERTSLARRPVVG